MDHFLFYQFVVDEFVREVALYSLNDYGFFISSFVNNMFPFAALQTAKIFCSTCV